MAATRLAVLVLLLLLAGCARVPVVPDQQFHAELGGLPAIERFVEDLLFRIADDPRIAHHFVDIDVLRLHEKLVEQICFESGGPCTYTGDPMKIVHAGLGITEADFNVLVEHLVDAMQAEGVPRTAQNRLLRRLAPMRADVLGEVPQ